MQKSLKALKFVDWFMAVGSIAVGLYLQSSIFIAAGLLSLLIAWYSPAERIKKVLEKKFLRKTPAPSDTGKVAADDQFYAEVLQPAAEEAESTETSQDAAPYFGHTWPKNGPLYLHSSKHNQLRPEHLTFKVGENRKTWA